MRFLGLLLTAFLFLSSPALAKTKKAVVQPEDIESITVLTTGAMAVPIAELCKQYSRKANIDVNAVFNSEEEIYENILDGDPADIVILPSQEWFEKLDEQGLLDTKSKGILAKDRLIIAASKVMNVPHQKNMQSALQYIYNRSLMVIADPVTTGLGEQTKMFLDRSGNWEKFKGRVILAPTSSTVADLVIKGQQAGVIYASQMRLNSDKLQQIFLVPEKMHKPVEYSSAVVVGNDMEQARKFLEFLSSEDAKKLLKSRGFVVQ